MRGPDTDRLVLEERGRIVAYLATTHVAGHAYAIDNGRHLPYPPLEPGNDEHAVLMERGQAAAYLRRALEDKLASDIEAGKHVPDGR